MDGMVQISLEQLLELAKKAEQRDAMLRFAAMAKYGIDKQELFKLCGEEMPQKEEPKWQK